MAARSRPRILTPPNVLSFVRLFGAAFLPPVLASGSRRAFLWIFVVLVATDWLDGRLARRFAWRTRFGAMLDSVADKAVHLGALVALAWALPATFLRELPWIVAAVGMYAAAATLSLMRFRTLPGYHTVAAKVSWVAVGAGFIALVALDLAWPFRAALGLAVLTNVEILAIAAVLDEPRVDVPSFAAALRLRRR